ncbi:MAG TPA: hypothetical protein VG095_05985 [Chthoniobacterales bacterium]|nr:hypothetical protein [Chthoniobacterales bacterium]
MQRFLLMATALLALFLNGCANDSLEPEVTERAPAPYSPDPMRHAPGPQDPLPYAVDPWR